MPVRPALHPRAHLDDRGLRPKKSFGQNFLHDETHVAAIAAEVLGTTGSPPSAIVELGGGTGALTAHLVAGEAPVHVVERDRDLVPVLKQRFAEEVESGKLTVHEANATTFDVASVLGHAGTGALCGNLPYHLTSTLLLNALDTADSLRVAVFLIQKEVADRVAAPPGTKAYGLLSVLLAARFDARLVRVVPAGAFWPVPEVDGGVLRLTPVTRSDGEVPLEALKRVAKAAFGKRRKTLHNSLKAFAAGDQMLEAAGLDPKARPETLDVEAFLRLARALEKAEGSERA